ncbi:unnamed protein product [Alternaria alternata]
MNFKDRLLGRPSVDDRSARESLELPRFSFEGDNHPLVSTERLFRQWQQEENSGYEAGQEIMEEGLPKGDEIILCNGVLADTWSKEERGKGQAIYGILTWLAPCVAPICGAYISEGVSWRWIFWATSIFTVFVQVTAFFFLSETFAPAILAKKAKAVRKAMRGIRNDVVVRTEFETGDRMSKILRKRLILPFIMMFTHPATQAPSIYRAFLYGVMYLMLSTFPMVFEDVYDMDTGHASLNYLSLCLGFMIGLQISHPLMDGLYARMKTYYNLTEGLPEFRVPPMLIAGVVCPIGLFVYGWSAQNEVHFIIPNLGAVILAIGLIIGFQCSQAYTTDAYEARYAASAASVGAFMRTMCGFSFPLFAPQIILDDDIGDSDADRALVLWGYT